MTGETAEEFARNATQAYTVLAHGLLALLPELQQPQPVATVNEASTAPASVGSAAASQEGANVATGSTPSDTSSASPMRAADSFPASDQVGVEAPPSAGPIGPEEVSKRLGAVIHAAKARGWSQERANNYARKLLASIGGATRVPHLDTDAKRADFMGNSEAFLAGMVAE